MGSPLAEPCRWENEKQHLQTISHWTSFPSTEVTRGQYRLLMGSLPASPNPIRGRDDACPVAMTSWNDAAAFCNELSAQENIQLCYRCEDKAGETTCKEQAGVADVGIIKCMGYRLPTEVEWEYAYRAGTDSAYNIAANSSCSGVDAALDEAAWYDANSGETSHPVGLKRSNALGLYDMAGNVWEWTNSSYKTDSSLAGSPAPIRELRVIRGGSFGNYARKARAASRDALFTHESLEIVGFRCVRTTDKSGR